MALARPAAHAAARTTARTAVLALAATALVGVVGVAPAHAEDAVAGAQTAGDSLFPQQGNGGYDVSHYDIKLKVDVGIATTSNAASTTTVDATTTISASTTGAPLSSYSLDFQGTSTTLAASTLNVSSVTVDGQPASFERIENTTIPDATTDKHKLVITPATPVSGSFTTVVKYAGQPVVHRDTDNSIEGWNNTVDGATFVNQPVGSMTLFPNNNTPRDKATYTWTVDAPSTLRTSNLSQAGGKAYQAGVVSNGELLSRTASDDGSRTTWVWDQKKPQASELSLFSIGRYDIYSSEITLASGRTIPEWTFIDPALSVANQTTTLSTRAQLKSLLDFYETKYGPYPGNSTGLVTDNTTGINYALETQDRPFFPGSASRGTTYHEVMHQWWGDNVAPTDWNDITLNEGPAQYSEFQFPYEGAGSATTTTEQANYNLWSSRSASSSTFAIAPAAMTDAGDLFGEQVYEKGSLTLEALRTSIGAADFEKLMRQYQLQYGGGQITGRRTAAFQALAESISGRDLSAFFQSWWFTSGKPAWPVKFNLDVAGPTGQVNAGDAVTYTLSTRNTGKVAMAAAGTTIKVDVSDVLDDATVGTLPTGVTLDGTTLTWSVPATALGATSSVDVPFTTGAESTGHRLTAVARAATLGGTCVSCTASTVIGTAPVPVAPAPTIDGLTGGAPVVDQPLTASTAGWDGGTSFAYQWLVGGTPVPGATNASWTPTLDVVGNAVTVRVTGTQEGYLPTTATSAATAVGVRATPTSSTPTITGTPKLGEKLTVDPGAWQAGTVFTYQWRSNGTNITSATGPVYTPAVNTTQGQVGTGVGQSLDVVVTGTKAGYTTTSKTVAAGTVAAADAQSSTPTPELSGTPKVGTPYQPAYGTWDDGVTLTYQWTANGTNVSGTAGTGATLTPTAAQVGQVLTVKVSGAKGGVAVVKESAASPAVVNGTQVLQPTPTVTGTPRPGTVVTGVPGTWDSGTTRALQWLLDGTPINGATGTTYTPTVDQIGQALTFRVTSTRSGYDTVVKTSDPVTVLGSVQTLTPTPTVSGTPQVGHDLTVDPGTWDDGTTLAVQWKADGDPIDGATSATYRVGAAAVGKAITVTVTSTKPTYETVSRTSDPTAAVVEGDLEATPVPTIAGTPKVGRQLTAVPGTWDSGVTLAYRWKADGQPIDGVTTATYTLPAAMLGKVVTVTVTGTKAGYAPQSKTSEPTTAVAAGDLTATPVPTINGTPKVGTELTAVPGTWDSGVTLAYQWNADGEPVNGATGSTFVPAPSRAGAVITVTVTGTKAGYTTVSRTSAATAAVAKGDLETTPVPTVTGTPQVGVELTAVAGDWDSGVSLAYQWYLGTDPIAGATGSTYTPTADQAGEELSVAVTGTKAGFAPVTRTSAPTAPVADGDLAATPAPTLSGTPKVDVEVTAEPGTWDAGVALAYQWYLGDTAIEGATDDTYTPTADQAGEELSVRVTGTKAGYAGVTESSEAATVAAGDLVLTPAPTVSGTVRVGGLVSAVAGTWDAGTTLTYRWTRNGATIAGATSATYRPVVADFGRSLAVVVTGSKDGYTSVSRTSAARSVAAGTQTRHGRPVVTGKAKVGRTLGVRAAYDAGTSVSYTWLANGRKVGAKKTLKVTASMKGKRLSVRVTVKKTGYVTLILASSPTAKVVR